MYSMLSATGEGDALSRGDADCLQFGDDRVHRLEELSVGDLDDPSR